MASAQQSDNQAMLPHNLQIYLYNVDNNTLSPLLYNDTNLDNDWESLSFNLDNYDDSFNYKILFFIHQSANDSFADIGFDDIVYKIDDDQLVAFVSETSPFTFILQGRKTTPNLSVLANQETAFVRVTMGNEGGKVHISETPKSTGLTVYNGHYLYFEGSGAFNNDVYLLSDVIPARPQNAVQPETPDVSDDESDDELVPVSPLIFKSGAWKKNGNYIFLETRGDLLIYRLSWTASDRNYIQYNKDSKKWEDGSTLSAPTKVEHRGSEVVLSSDQELAVFDNPYYQAPVGDES
jgi:hypothetical protein